MKNSDSENSSCVFLYISTICVNLMSFCAGIAYGWTSPSLAKLFDTNSNTNPIGQAITTQESAWITSLLSLGAAFGPLLSGYSGQKFGRKKTLLVFAIPMLISDILLFFANSVTMFYIARFLSGLECGCVFTIIPVYLVEISEVHNRGVMTCFVAILCTCGILFVSVLGPYFTIPTIAVISMVPIVLFLIIFSLWMPESPYFLVTSGNEEAAIQALIKLRQRQNVGHEFLDIKGSKLNSTAEDKVTLSELLKNKVALKSLMLTNGLFVFQQLTGYLGVMSYLQLLLSDVKGLITPEVSVMLINFVQVLTSVFTTFFVDKLGRKILILVSLLGTSLSIGTLGLYFYLSENQYNISSISWLPIVTVMTFLVAFSCGMGPLPWTVTAEIFSPKIKSLATTISATVCLTMSFIMTLIFPSLVDLIGLSNTFWCFSIICVLGFVFSYYLLPETKGKTYAEIELLLLKKSQKNGESF